MVEWNYEREESINRKKKKEKGRKEGRKEGKKKRKQALFLHFSLPNLSDMA
jgi:hypothetical protein